MRSICSWWRSQESNRTPTLASASSASAQSHTAQHDGWRPEFWRSHRGLWGGSTGNLAQWPCGPWRHLFQPRPPKAKLCNEVCVEAAWGYRDEMGWAYQYKIVQGWVRWVLSEPVSGQWFGLQWLVLNNWHGVIVSPTNESDWTYPQSGLYATYCTVNDAK